MDPQRWQQIEQLYYLALERETTERNGFLIHACQGDAELLREVESLLEQSGSTEAHVAGGELEQIQFLLGHVSVQTTERYLGSKQKLKDAVNDHIGIEPID